MQNIGLITYHAPHLKTEQVIQNLIKQDYSFRIYALPFTRREPLTTLFPHRPDQLDAVAPQAIADKHGIPYLECTSDKDIDDLCNVYLILGAGILSAECVEGKRIINCHPGILPAVRGLDSFKWAILKMKPLGVTLHYVDNQIDAGEIISVIPTNVYLSDSVSTLARRHYENEILCLSYFKNFIDNPQNPFALMKKEESTTRMHLGKEKELARMFSEYTDKYGK